MNEIITILNPSPIDNKEVSLINNLNLNQIPFQILSELAESYGILINNENLSNKEYLEQVITYISLEDQNIKTKFNTEQLSNEQYRILARFLNNNVNWTKPHIINNFKFLQSFLRYKNTNDYQLITFLNKNINNIKIDRLNNTHPLTIGGLSPATDKIIFNGLIVYKLCLIFNLIDPNRVIESVDELWSLVVKHLNKFLTPKYDFNHIATVSQIYNKYNNYPSYFTSINDFYFKDFIPLDEYEAIVFGLFIYNIDLTLVLEPIKQYQLLQNYRYDNRFKLTKHDIQHYLSSLEFKRKSKDLDDVLAFRLNSKDKESYSPFLNLCFNPHIPFDIYSKEILYYHAGRYGISIENRSLIDLYQQLQINILSDNFYVGRNNLINTTTDIDYDDIASLNEHEVVSFGIRNLEPLTDRMSYYHNQNKNSFYGYTYDELNRTFLNMRSFQMPNKPNGIEFEEHQINRLIVLCNDEIKDREPAKARLNLVTTINRLKEEIKLISKEVKQMCNIYHNDKVLKPVILNILNNLVEMTMYMRGWRSKNKSETKENYPLINTSVFNQTNVDINTNLAIHKFEESCLAFPLFLNLPLYRYIDGKYVASSTKESGLTIGQRLNIVKLGYSSDNVSACIRITSNLFGASAHYYLQLLGVELPFDIKELRYIS